MVVTESPDRKKNTSSDNSLINFLQGNVKSIKSNNSKVLVNLINQLTDDNEFLVPSIIISTHCKINLDNITNTLPMLLDTKEIEI